MDTLAHAKIGRIYGESMEIIETMEKNSMQAYLVPAHKLECLGDCLKELGMKIAIEEIPQLPMGAMVIMVPALATGQDATTGLTCPHCGKGLRIVLSVK